MMSLWSELYPQEKQPDFNDFTGFVNSPLWNKFHELLQKEYKTAPKIEYSKCSAQRGWNIKYKKSGKSLCTLYPMENYFIALVVINEKMKPRAGLVINECGEYLQDLFMRTPFSCGGQWMMIHVSDKLIFEDLMKLIFVRSKYG